MKKILILSGLVWSISGFSQTTELRDSYQPPQTVANTEVRMLIGFHANSNDGNYTGGKVFRAIVGNPTTDGTQPPVVYNPSSGENYIYTRSYLAPVTSSNAYAPQVQGITYFDGLGRPKQSIAIKSTPGGNDLVTPIEYDAFGRQTKDFLPIPVSSLNGGIQAITGNNIDPYYWSLGVGGNAFTEKKLESSPLDRLLEQYGPGDDWRNNSKRSVFDYLANSANEVLRFKTTTSWSGETNAVTNSVLSLDPGTYYPEATLYKNKVTDEDENVSYEYKNGQGQTLLVRKMNGPDPVDTYYVYNEYDQLAYVISPLASQQIRSNTSADLSSGSDIVSKLCYQYKYDGRNRLASKKLPGKGWEYMVYDKADKLVMTQDANLGSQGKWLFTKYDQFSRVIYTGILDSPPGRDAQQTAVNNQATYETRTSSGFNNSGLDVYYTTNMAYPTTNFQLLTVNYYDTYPPYPDLPSIGGADQYGQKFLTQSYTSSDSNPNTQISTKGLPTASLVKTMDANTWTKTYTFYDQKARPVYTESTNHLGGYTRTGSQLDFSGVVLKSYTRHKRSSAGTPAEVTVNERFVYDNQNRLKQHYHQVDGNNEVLLADNNYDELGRLSSKKVGNNLQEINYTYNIRGWLSSINNIDNLGNDLFAYKINYNTKEGLETPNLDYTGLKVKPKYNGNIAEVAWKNLEYVGMTPSATPHRQGFVYDNLNRLLAGFYQNPDAPASKDNSEIIDYDQNGNIQHLKRTGAKSKGVVKVIDNLTYTYSGNQVTHIADASGLTDGYEGGGGLIEYDQNGNMTRMPDKGISQIGYNFLNLPTAITQSNPTAYIYRADGAKLKKTFTVTNDTGTANVVTEYLDGFQYASGVSGIARGVLDSDDPETLNFTRAGEVETYRPLDPEELINGGTGPGEQDMTMRLKFFPTAEGFYNYNKKQYIYQYKDHLGNVRLSFGRDTDTGDLAVLDFNNYYPFGMNFSSAYSVFDAQGTAYNYKYSSKELQEFGGYDFGARVYSPDAPMFWQPDPMAETSRSWSPYAYAYLNPMRFVDPDGRQNEDWIRKDGKWQYDASVTTVEQAQKIEGVDGFAKDGTVLSNAKIGAEGESGYVRLNEGGKAEYVPNTNGSATLVSFSNSAPMWMGGTWTTWEPSTFTPLDSSSGSFQPGKNEFFNPYQDKILNTGLFDWFSPIGRDRMPDFLLGLSDISSLAEMAKSDVKKSGDTFSFYGEQSIGVKSVGVGFGIKSQTVNLQNITKGQLDSVRNRFNSDNIKYNNKLQSLSDSLLRKMQSR